MTPPAGRLHDKIALVTGGGTGIGRAISLLFAREGARIIVVGRRAEPLQQVVKEIRDIGGTATLCKGDVSKADGVELLVQGAAYQFGGLDILVNNAGIFAAGSVVDLTERRWDKVLGTNLKGAYLVSHYAIPVLRARGGGSIINVASVHGLIAMKDAAAYCASKGGLIHLTRAMALDHAADRIRVNAICPGVVDSPFTRENNKEGAAWLEEAARAYPAGRPGTPEEVAGLALYLASDESQWMTGAALPLDGGSTVI